MEKKTQKSSNIALGGVFSGLCLVVMFMSGIFPFATYAMPALAGVMISIVLLENGVKIAMMVYISVSLLTVFVVTDLEAVIMFTAFFGYYPILKAKVEQLKIKLLQYLIKFAVFNVVIIGVYSILMYIFRLPDLIEDLGEFGKYTAIGLIVLANFTFIIYDFALDRFLYFYKIRLRKKVVGE